MSEIAERVWTIEERAWSDILGHIVSTYPQEACGILLSGHNGVSHIVEVHPTRNATSENPAIRYFVDPLEFLEVDKWADRKGLDICGFYHSHPDHPCVPSEYDQETAWEGYLYVILSIKGGLFSEARAWTLDQETRHFKEVSFHWHATEGCHEISSSP